MKKFGIFILIIIVALGIGKRLKTLSDQPEKNLRFAIINLQKEKGLYGGSQTYLATVVLGNDTTIYRCGDNYTIMEAENTGEFATVDDDVLIIEDLEWHKVRNPYYNSVSKFQDYTDRLVKRMSNYISDAVVGWTTVMKPDQRINYPVRKFTAENNVSSESEKMETKKNLKILKDSFYGDFITRRYRKNADTAKKNKFL